MLWIGIIIGIFVGAIIGIFTIAICISAKEGDKQRSLLLNDRLSRLDARNLHQ
jgi:gas vesicle protein